MFKFPTVGRRVALVSSAALAISVAAGLALSDASIARACGGFFRSAKVAPEKRPSLTREKVLLIYDAEEGEQHFIREVAFKRAAEPFGFVVPTPTRPKVETVAKTPFTALRDRFPFDPPGQIGRGSGSGSGKGGAGFGGAGVTVLEVKKVGSFTAFVLAATDESALAKWLSDNGLVSTPEADAWLAHYVHMGFYYVAMRYDPPRKGGSDTGEVKAETVRITFDTPLPYYPYLEPTAPSLAVALNLSPRLLELWFVGTQPVVPIALRDKGGNREWVRPLRAGERVEGSREAIAGTLEPEIRSLLPQGELVLQTFQDQKNSRTGFHDVLFASEKAKALTPERLAELRPLLPILDPELGKEAAR